MTSRAQSFRTPSLWLAMAALSLSTTAEAQVIEIGDDGAITTYSKPAQFFGDQTHDFTSKSPGRAAEVDPYERAAAAEGVDVHLLRAVAWTESRGHQSAVSPKGARGVMQLMPATAAELGVDPLDPDANLHGGARYLARQLSRFQSIPLALAAYNAGPGAVLRWGGIPPYAETQAYVAQILSRYQGSLLRPIAREAVVQRPAHAHPMLIEVSAP